MEPMTERIVIDWEATEASWKAHRIAVAITAWWWGWGFDRTVRYYETHTGWAIGRTP
jgi:hypothetical protein